jgi:hypothetical protein
VDLAPTCSVASWGNAERERNISVVVAALPFSSASTS